MPSNNSTKNSGIGISSRTTDPTRNNRTYISGSSQSSSSHQFHRNSVGSNRTKGNTP